MPELAKHHTVYAIDLPGVGDSMGTPAAFDKKTLAGNVVSSRMSFSWEKLT